MAVTYKDIGQLTQKSSLAGTEKIVVSDTQYITPAQITAGEAKAAWFDPATTTMYWFASNADKASFIADRTQTGLVLYSAFIAFSVKRVLLEDSEGETAKSVTSDEATLNITVDFEVQEKPIVGGSWETMQDGAVDITVSVDAGNTGSYSVLATQHFSGPDSYTFDVRNSIILGTNKVKVDCVSSDDASVSSSIEYTVSLLAEAYITFTDPNVGAICATQWGDGVGITKSQAALVTDNQFGTTFQSNSNISSFDELILFSGVTTIPNNAFRQSSLEYVKFDASIGDSPFRECASLKRVDVGASCSAIANAAFYNAGTTTNKCIFIFRGTTPPTLGNTNIFTANRTEKIYVPDAAVETYKTANRWTNFASLIDAISNYTG